MLPDADRNRIQHMVEAARLAMSFVESKSRNDLDVDAQLRLALLHALEIVGEAASRVSSETRESHPQIPWRRVIGTRNRLSHAYFDVDLDIVWTTVTGALPELVLALEAILESEGERDRNN